MFTKHVFLKVLGFTLLALLAGVYLTSLKAPDKQHAGFPWQIKVLQSGHTQVFSLIIGQSTLGEAEQQLKEVAEITLFSAENTPPVIEAFFAEVKIGGLKSKMVMSIDLPQAELENMFNRGARIATLGSGTRKVTLSSDDAKRVRDASIASITYLPSINLNAELIEKRFGTPTEKVADSSSDAIHWLYPEKGVDVALSEENKEVIQYVEPKKFDTLVQPLRSAPAAE